MNAIHPEGRPARSRPLAGPILSLLALAAMLAACTPPQLPTDGSRPEARRAASLGPSATREAAAAATHAAATGEAAAVGTEARAADAGARVTASDAERDAADLADAGPIARVAAEDGGLVPVTLMLDWVPNTNHTGIFVAQARGYFEAAGLDLEIVQPGEVYADQAVAGGAADFGISYQEALTLARSMDLPLVSVAAIVQHNSSAFASRAELGARSAADYTGLRYGSFGTPFELPTLAALMDCAGALPEAIDSVESVNAGLSDPLALLSEDRIDLAWIFLGWQGIQAEREGIALDLLPLEAQRDCIPDYYTPILMTREQTIDERPELVAALVGAVSRGYRFAIERPLEAAEILLEAAPELDRGLVIDSQTWLSPRYQADASRWGEQRLDVWDAYGDWMAAQGIMPAPIDARSAFSNAFLPGEGG